MKKKRTLQAAACAMALSTMLTVGASAASTVTATLRPDISVHIDGIERDFYNAQGKEVHPILFNGTTYIPLRAVGELMGKNVNWDNAAKTATIGGVRTTGTVSGTPDTVAKRTDVTFYLRPEFHVVIDGAERTFADVNGTRVDPAVYDGSIYLPIRAIGEIMGKTVRWDNATSTVLLDSASNGEVTDYDTSNPSAPGTGGTTTVAGSVTLERAKEIALNHAGKTASQVQFVKAKQDWEKGRMVYEIEFVSSTGSGYTEYDYEIDAAAGTILSYDYDIEGYAPAQNANSSTSANGRISADAAKKIALARVPGATSRNIYKFKLDFDDGRWEYEGEILYGSMEYEFTIDAATGTIVEWDSDSIYD